MATTSQTISNVIFKPVTNLAEAQEMRKIRNECREFMTRNTTYIREEEQEKWFDTLDKNNMKMYLVYETTHGVDFSLIGYGYCKNDITGTYLTGGLLDTARGKGYGRALFKHLVNVAKTFNNKILLEVLNTNHKAENLYKSLGFVAYSNISTDTTTGPFQIAEINTSGVVIGLFTCKFALLVTVIIFGPVVLSMPSFKAFEL